MLNSLYGGSLTNAVSESKGLYFSRHNINGCILKVENELFILLPINNEYGMIFRFSPCTSNNNDGLSLSS